MARKAKRESAKRSKKRARKPAKRAAVKRPAKKRQAKARAKGLTVSRADLKAVAETMHDLTNVATAMRAYLELLETQGALEPRQKYYLDRAQEQVNTLVTTLRDLREQLPQA